MNGRGFQHLLTESELEVMMTTGYNSGYSLKEVNINLYNILNLYKEPRYYRAIILVLASNFPNNKFYREVWKQYMFRDPSFKILFIYGKSDIALSDYNQEYDIISEKVNEGMGIAKVLEAFKLIERRFKYDYLVRTNLSTFWDFTKLHKHLDVLPKKNCYSGDGPLPDYNSDGYYLSGVDTIVSEEMISSINKNNNNVNINRSWEDESMGLYFHGVLGAPMLPNRICFFEDILSKDQVDLIRTRIDKAILENKDHYRVKNASPNREELDRCVYKELLKKIYGIDI
jgi:hypothetical protein